MKITVIAIALCGFAAGCHKKSSASMTADAVPIPAGRVVVIDQPITEATALQAIAQILYLESQSCITPIILKINCPGGLATGGMAILKAMDGLKSEVHTQCMGQAGGTAAIILARGKKGCRSATRQTSIGLGTLWLAKPGSSQDTENLSKIRDEMIQQMAKASNMTEQESRAALDSKAIFSSEEAVKHGIIDRIDE